MSKLGEDDGNGMLVLVKILSIVITLGVSLLFGLFPLFW